MFLDNKKAQNNMKILFDHQIFCLQQYGGVSRYYMELAYELNKNKDISIDIPVLFSKNQYLADQRNSKCCVVNNRWVDRLIKLINRGYTICRLNTKTYDIVHPTWHAPYIIPFARGKLVITIHDMIHEIYGPYNSKDIKNKKRSIYCSDAIIAISENTKNDILRFYPDISPDKISVIYHGTNHLPDSKKPKGISIPDKYILFVGKREEYKNAEILIKAVSDVVRENKDIVLFMAGGGGFKKEELELIKALKMERNIIQADISDAELAYLYRNAICFIYPSKYEGFGFPLLEAFDNECPVISSNASCLPEVGGEAALYFDPDDQKELCTHIKAMIDNEELRKDYISRGKKRSKFFSWEKTAEQTLDLYRRILL